MASKEANAGKPAAEEKKADAPAQVFAFEFSLPKDKIGEKTTNPQVKSKVNEAFMGWGAFDECRVIGGAGADRTVTVFFARLFGKGTPVWEALGKGEKPTIKIYDMDVEVRLTDAKPSGGGATSGTSAKPKKEAAKGEHKKKAPRKPAAEGGEAPKAEGGDKKDGEKKEGGRGRGRGRGKRDDEPKGPSLQRGRANVGGKLGQPSKIQIAKAAKAARDKENAARIARGEAPLADEKKKEEEPAPAKKEEKGKAGKKEAGKAEAGKKGGDAKKEAGKAEGGKKEGAKKGK